MKTYVWNKSPDDNDDDIKHAVNDLCSLMGLDCDAPNITTVNVVFTDETNVPTNDGNMLFVFIPHNGWYTALREMLELAYHQMDENGLLRFG